MNDPITSVFINGVPLLEVVIHDKHPIRRMRNAQMLCMNERSDGDFLDIFPYSILEGDSLNGFFETRDTVQFPQIPLDAFDITVQTLPHLPLRGRGRWLNSYDRLM